MSIEVDRSTAGDNIKVASFSEESHVNADGHQKCLAKNLKRNSEPDLRRPWKLGLPRSHGHIANYFPVVN